MSSILPQAATIDCQCCKRRPRSDFPSNSLVARGPISRLSAFAFAPLRRLKRGRDAPKGLFVLGTH
eukprot:629576-Pyramimonas_sp.AAC.1